MISPTRFVNRASFAGLILCLAALWALAGYKARPWTPRAADKYPARLTSEGVTIAVEPLYKDALAAQAFDKNDMVTRGIMPLAVAIFNDNDFPVTVVSSSIEIIRGEQHIHTLLPGDAASRLFKGGKGIPIPSPVPRNPTSGERVNPDALDDLEHKFLAEKTVEAHSKGGGFLYLHVPDEKLAEYLADARVYIPDVYRQDQGTKMIFFEIDLKPAIEAVPTN